MTVECPLCGQWVEMVGRQVPCPNCGQLLTAAIDKPLAPRAGPRKREERTDEFGEPIRPSRSRSLNRPAPYEPPPQPRGIPPWLPATLVIAAVFAGLFLILYFAAVKLGSYATPTPAPPPPAPKVATPAPKPPANEGGSELFSFNDAQPDGSSTAPPQATPIPATPPPTTAADDPGSAATSRPTSRPRFAVVRAKPPKDETVTDEAINAAIVKGVNFLLSQFENNKNKDRAGQGGYEIGAHALSVLALLHAGQAVSDERLGIRSPTMVGLLEQLKAYSITDGFPTYSRSLKAQALAVYARPEDRAALLAETQWLLSNAVKGSYSYREPPEGATQPHQAGWDNSNTQYGVLGVWAAAEAGIPVPITYWLDVQKHWEDAQASNGGWDYGMGPGGTGTLSMTAAGVNMLFVANEMISATRPDTQIARPPFSPALQGGLDWLATGDNAVTLGNWKYYTLYGLERAGLASGFKMLGKHDWFRVLAADTLASQDASGSWSGNSGADVETSFALLFLSRGRHPLLMNKLHFIGAWANRPRDVARLGKFVSREIEKPLNWQVVSLKSDWSEWMDSPILYLASHEAPIFDEADFDKLRAYVNAGGMLITQADGDAQEFSQWAELLAIKLFGRELQPLPAEHFAYTALFRPKQQIPLLGVSNATRTLMIHSPTDLAKRWQASKPTADRDPFDLGANLFVYSTGMAVPRNRVDTLHIEPLPGTASTLVPIARLKYSGDWDPEPWAWQREGRMFRRETSIGLEPIAIEIEKLTPTAAPFAHLTGTGAIALSDAQVEALRGYVESGGVLLIDSCGGFKPFNDSIRSGLLARAWAEQEPKVIATDHPLLAGKGDGLTQIARPLVRPYVFRMLGQQFPKLQILEAGKGAVLLSELDLTSGLLGTNTLGIIGFDPKYAHEFVRNAILWTINGRDPVVPWDQPTGAATTGPTTAESP